MPNSLKAWAIKGPDGTLSLPLKESDAWIGHDDVDVEYLKAQGFTCVKVTVTEASEQPAQGMVSVPGEPTGTMMVAGASYIPIQYANMVRLCYNAMIAARPK